MTDKQQVTESLIHDVCTDLYNNNLKVNLINIRKKIGFGSYTTIKKYLKSWQEKHEFDTKKLLLKLEKIENQQLFLATEIEKIREKLNQNGVNITQNTVNNSQNLPQINPSDQVATTPTRPKYPQIDLDAL